MNVLGIETSSIVASVAIMTTEELVGEITVNHPRQHSQVLMPLIDSLFNTLDMTMDDIDLIAVSNGPGSFTGIRIALSTAKALAHKKNIPISVISSLEALSYNELNFDGLIIPMIDGRRGRIYTQEFKNDDNQLITVSEEQMINIHELIEILNQKDEKIIILGSGIRENRDVIDQKLKETILISPPANILPNAKALCQAALKKDNNSYKKYDAVEANYFRKSQAERSIENN